MTDTVIDVLVVDDHPVVRQGLAGMLASEADLRVVGTAHDGVDAVLKAAELAPDVVLMDLRLPGLDGVGATEQIKTARPATQVLVLTTYDTDGDIIRAVAAGASGYLLKDIDRDALTTAIRAAARGETVLAPPVAAILATRIRTPKLQALTPRETQVLAGVAQGGTNAEIARELFIGEATVKTHLLRIFAKLGVDDRTRAVTIAFEHDLLPGPR